jgi:phage-related protein/predicted XRE-type DNA-binding protein
MRRRELFWVGSTLDDLRRFPEEVRLEMGHALHLAQMGEKSPDAKPMRGFHGAGVLEVVENYGGNTYRAVYTVKLESGVYALHAFQSEVAQGHRDRSARPRAREEAATGRRANRPGEEDRKESGMSHSIKAPVTRSSGNVFEDLRVAEPAEALAKSELAALIARALRARRLTQTAAARLLGIDQPKVSELLRGRLTRFSTERLMSFLTLLGRDVEIVVRGPVSSGEAPRGRIHVRATRSRIREGKRPGLLEANT